MIKRTPTPKIPGIVGRATDALKDDIVSAFKALDDALPKLTSTSVYRKAGSAVAQTGHMVLVDPSVGITVIAPVTTDQGKQFGIKNDTNDTSDINVEPLGQRMEDAGNPGTFTTSRFTFSGAGVGYTWTWLGTGQDAAWHITSQSGATASGPGGGAPTDAQYVVVTSNADLTAERVITAGTGIKIVDNGSP